MPAGADTVERIDALLARREIDVHDVYRRSLSRMRKSCAEHVFVGDASASAEHELGAATLRRRAGASHGAFDGVPVAWKDLFDRRGEVTGAGSATREGAPPAVADAETVAHVARQGAISIGRTNTSEFAFSGVGINPFRGTPANPWSPDVPRVPGGSSSGSAVAVALGIVPVAFGTDTSGSVRVPAALNGLVGYRPSGGRVSRAGVFELSPTLDTVGPIALTVCDARLADRALRGLDTRGPLPMADPRQRRFVIPEGRLLDGLDPVVRSAFDAFAARLEVEGASVERRRVAALEAVFELFERHGTLVAIEAASTLRSYADSEARGRIDPRVLRRLDTQRHARADALHALLEGRRALCAALSADLDRDCLLHPTVVRGAPRTCPLLEDDARFDETNAMLLRNTMPASFLDMPSIALPMGRDAHGMPISASVSTTCGLDDWLLAVADTLDRRVACPEPRLSALASADAHDPF